MKIKKKVERGCGYKKFYCSAKCKFDFSVKCSKFNCGREWDQKFGAYLRCKPCIDKFGGGEC